MSEDTAKKIDAEVKKIVDKGYERARKVLTEKIDDLHKIAKALLIYETPVSYTHLTLPTMFEV